MDFVAWPKIPRLNKDMVVTEKIDGTNGAIIIETIPNPRPDLPTPRRGTISLYGDGKYEPVAIPTAGNNLVLIGAQSRKRLITPEDDNFGFAKWVFDNAQALYDALGVGRHYGEWWGSGIQRGYGLIKGEKRFSLFNVNRYGMIHENADANEIGLDVVPTLYTGPFDLDAVQDQLDELRDDGSLAAPGFMNPEGVVIYHVGAGTTFKAFVDADDEAAPKGARG